ncbi:MAG: TraR/DksA family transcriptional regulator [Rhodoferax sp.]
MSAKPASNQQHKKTEQALLARLNQRATELEGEIASKEQRQPAHDGKDHTHEVMDRGEEANHHVRVEVRNAEIDRDRTELRNIAIARERIEAGTYFDCADCGKAINVERLEAQPTATRCIACQEKAEKADERRA